MGGALVIGSAAFVNSSYAAESKAPSQIPVETKVGDIHIPDLAQGASHKTTVAEEHKLKQLNTTGKQGKYGLVIRQLYRGANGAEIMVIQTESQMDEETTIEKLKDSYKLENVELTKINGHTAAYVNGKERKVVHLITKDHFYTISAFKTTLDELMEIAKKIRE
ncbi:DUF4367 domain-containing protein [Paenibacillus polymyxa]|nr:DUF4367 domain-containing protein [Paenibacillus polymyxa]